MTGIHWSTTMALAESMAVKYIFMFIKHIFILNVHFIVLCIYLLLRLLKDEISNSFMFFTMLGGVLVQ